MIPIFLPVSLSKLRTLRVLSLPSQRWAPPTHGCVGADGFERETGKKLLTLQRFEGNLHLVDTYGEGEKKSTVEIRNKKAGFEYEFIESFTAGIVLNGTEIKSIRAGKASLVDSWCYFVNGELYVKNMNVAEYWWGSAFSRQDPKRDRKLLLSKKELRKLARAVKEKGLTIVATRLFIADNGYAKLNIALARGKREFDKRESIKEKDMRRDSERD